MLSVIGCVKCAPTVVPQSLVAAAPVWHAQLLIVTVTELSVRAVPSNVIASPNSLTHSDSKAVLAMFGVPAAGNASYTDTTLPVDACAGMIPAARAVIATAAVNMARFI
jgi:hypothetical protein